MSATNLPLQFTKFFGRETELVDATHLLNENRLVTITGTGGSGKTRLALEVSVLQEENFPAGLHFVSLAAIHDPALVIPTINQTLEIAESSEKLPFESLKEALKNRQMLLILDNFEQIISAAPLLAELLAATKHLKLLVTSREALRLRGEQEFSLMPLQVVRGVHFSDQISLEALREIPSIALFVDRAQARQPDFQLTKDNMVTVAEICARLDGLPLAIELAAGRIKFLSAQDLQQQLQGELLPILRAGPHDLPDRQQTLTATIRWSYALLKPFEQSVFRALAVFIGGCSLEAAREIAQRQLTRFQKREQQQIVFPGDQQSWIIIEILGSLVEKNLILRADNGHETRFTMLETIREFGCQELIQFKESEAVQQDCAIYYLGLVEDAEAHLTGKEQKFRLDQLVTEQENLRAALDWGFNRQSGLTKDRQVDYVLRLTGALWRYWYLKGQWAEGRRWLEQVLQDAEAVPLADPAGKRQKAKVLYAAATIIRRQKDFSRARSLCEESARLYRQVDDQAGLLAALLQLGRIRDYQGDYQGIEPLLAEARRIAEDLPDQSIKAQAYLELPILSDEFISLDKTKHYFQEGERIYRKLENPSGLAYALFNLAALAEFIGDSPEAQSLWVEVEQLIFEIEDKPLQGRFLSRQAIHNWQQGNFELARNQLEELLLPKQKAQSGIGGISSGQEKFFIGVLAAVLYGQNMPIWSARLFGLFDALSSSGPSSMMRWKFMEPHRTAFANIKIRVREQLGEEAFAQAAMEGQALTLQDIGNIPHPEPTSIANQAEGPDIREPLTPREIEVLAYLAEGISNPEIAQQLVISPRTVDAHCRSIYGKLNVSSRYAAVQAGQEAGYL